MPDNRAASSGSTKKRDKKSKPKGNEKTTTMSTATTTTKSNVDTKNFIKNKQNKKENTKEQNNNLNKSKKLNLNICKSDNLDSNNDEIITNKITEAIATDAGIKTSSLIEPDSASIVTEEFDFDDTDLQELNDNIETAIVVDDDEALSQTLNTNDNNNDSTNINAIYDNVDNTHQQIAKENELVLPTMVESVEEYNHHKLMSSNDMKKSKATPPSALDFKQTMTDVENTTLPKTYCPITPRRIVDIEEFKDDEAPNRVLRSSSSKNIIGSSKNNESLSTNKATTEISKNTAKIGDAVASTQADDKTTGNGDGDDDDDDYYDTDEPDDELLVQFLGEANQIAEARLAARRQARAEAREIRMRELERQQKEQEQNADRVFDMHTASGIDPLSRSRLTAGINSNSPVGGLLNSARGSSMSSRRSSEDSLEEEGRSLRDIRHELRDVEERFRKAMIANAQLDNERASQTYQIQLLKDKLEEMEESYSQLQREFKEKSRDCNALKRNLDKLSEELKLVQGQLSERDTLIADQGLVIVTVENEDGSDAKRALVSCENAHLLGSVQGSLDVRLKKFSEEKQKLLTEVQQLQEQLENHKSQGKGRGNSMNGPTSGDEEYEAQREANKIITEYKYKLQKAEQEIANLQASLQRSETQVVRYKSTAEAAEKAEAELKIERRKLQRENREAMERLEELETSNNHLLKRLDKLKNAKSALLKDL